MHERKNCNLYKEDNAFKKEAIKMSGKFDEKVIELAQELIKVNSFETKGKVELMNYVKEILEKEAKAKVELYDMNTRDPYLIARRECNNPEYKLLLSGHLDVVSPEGMEMPFNPTIKSGVMWGRGSADMKSGCAAQMVAFIETAKLTNQRSDIYLIFTTDEEYAAEKIKVALENKHVPKCDFCIISEPTEGQIGVEHKGEAWIEVLFTGKSAHSSVPHEGINAIYQAADFTKKIQKHGEYPEFSELPHTKQPNMGVGVIHGGTDANVVPPLCSVIVDKRYPYGQTLENFIDEINEIINQCKEDNHEFKATMSVKGNWPPTMFPTDSEIFVRIKKAIDSKQESPTKTVTLPSWAEGGFIQMYDIPVIYYGPGSIDYAHNPNEQVNIEDVISVTEGIYSVLKEIIY